VSYSGGIKKFGVFDGAGSKITTDFDSTSVFTYSAWIYPE
jgi:hypothetical protein